MSDTHYTAEELMTVAAARQLRDGQVVFVGIGLPSQAANLARLTNAPGVVLIYESGTIGAAPDVLPLSIGDDELADSADVVVGLPEIFAYWLQAGRVDVGFLSAAQIDRFGNLNSTVIGTYANPTVRLPGAGGAPEIASSAGTVIVMLRHSQRTFVPEVDFITSVGFGRHGEGRAGHRGSGPSVVITDLGVLEPDPDRGELRLTAVHPGVEVSQVLEATDWPLLVDNRISTTEPPEETELQVLRDLMARTRRAHGGGGLS